MLLKWWGVANYTETEATTTDWTLNFPSGKSFSQLNIFSPEGKIGNLGWPRNFGAIVIPGFKSSIPPFIHAIRNMD